MADDIESILEAVRSREHQLQRFMHNVADFFGTHPVLTNGHPAPVHSVKSRVKDYDHLRQKIIRKTQDGATITAENVFSEVTDLIGVRVLHLYQDQFPLIHEQLMREIAPDNWELHEPPKAYTWDPETQGMFERLGISAHFKDSYYTSVHYVVRPNVQSPLRCEIQVRTLFEEVWGEIDHAINYPIQSDSVPCVEQLRVLAKLVSTGTRLADAVFRTYQIGNGQTRGA